MEFFKQTKTIHFMGAAIPAVGVSILLMIASVVLLATKGLNYGIDFAGGTVVQVKYDAPAPLDDIRKKLAEIALYDGAQITEFGAPEEIIIRLKSSTKEVDSDVGDVTRQALEGSGTFEIRRVDMVGPKVGNELREKGVTAMLLAILGILIYVAFRFEWRFGIASIVALVHDVTIAMGAIALFGIDVNLDVLAALLTLLGYSLNDTIIVFDRIREGVTDSKSEDLPEVINDSVTKTLSRTTLTSLTTFFVVLTLYLFGGEIISPFAFTLLVGVIVGTYSSIFIASPTLMWFGFNIRIYRRRLAEAVKREAEKQRMREMYEHGTM